MSTIPIKSVRRVFEILEMFAREKRPLSAKEISDRLEYPLMSAHALMKSMHSMGYLDFGNPKWAYSPSRKFLGVLDWCREQLDRDNDLIDFAENLNEITGETINLSRQFGFAVKIIFGLETRLPVGVSVSVGTEMPLTKSLTGLTALSCMTNEQLGLFLPKLRRHDPEQAKQYSAQLIDETRRQLDKWGMVTMCDVYVDGIGAVCFPVRSGLGEQLIVLGVVGPSARIAEKESEHRQTIRKLARKHGIKSVFPLSEAPKSASARA